MMASTECHNPCRQGQQQWQATNNSNYQFVKNLGRGNTCLITKSHDLLVLVHWETHKPDFTILRENVKWLICLKRRFQTLKPILCMTVTLFSAIFWSGSVDKGFFSTRPTWRSCLCQVCPISASQDGESNFLFTFSKVTCTWPGFQQTMVFSHDLERTKSPNQRQQST